MCKLKNLQDFTYHAIYEVVATAQWQAAAANKCDERGENQGTSAGHQKRDVSTFNHPTKDKSLHMTQLDQLLQYFLTKNIRLIRIPVYHFWDRMSMKDLIILLSITESDASVNKHNHISYERHDSRHDHDVYLKV